MPPRKEPKESVVYPSSKRKTPAFKPLRPSKVQRTGSETSVKPKSAAKKPAAAKRAKSVPVDDSEEEDGVEDLTTQKTRGGVGSEDEDSETLEDDPLAAATKSKTKQKPTSKNAAPRRKDSTRDPSPMSISSNNDNEPPDDDAPPTPSQSDSVPSIPQPLLVRLLHEAFADKNTKIDTHAIQVLQKYVEIFVREAMARTEAEKKEAAARGDCSDMDAGWLEVEDLEKVVAGLLLDF
ncbi:hypothetical protein PRZ48_002607 [Zasmidium cellare]|uniref:Centromere protein X n=1 Tax=Zasmidium cellare TaxID=395010 RepID=A0ABR0ESQ7_ZASCE|nr:hypothetical protein PRZ48_002607 [Zasmidium cellare]